MHPRRFWIALLALVWLSAQASAHGGEKHGAGIEGAVKTLTEDTLVVATGNGDVNVTLTEKTAIVDGANRALGREALRSGLHVKVGGHKLPGGGIAATEILVQQDPGR